MSDYYPRILQLERNLGHLSETIDNDVGMRFEYLLAEAADLRNTHLELLKPITAAQFKYHFEEYRLNVLKDASIDQTLEVIGLSDKHWEALSKLPDEHVLIYRCEQSSYHFIRAELKKLEKQPTINDLSDVTTKVIDFHKKTDPKFDFPGLLVYNKVCSSFSTSLWRYWMGAPDGALLTNSFQLKIYNYLAALAKEFDEVNAKKEANAIETEIAKFSKQ